MLFTSQKHASQNPLIGNKLLNRLGLHIIRIILAHFCATFRQTFIVFMLPKKERVYYKNNGYLAIPNYFDSANFKQLKQEVIELSDEANYIRDGDSYTQIIPLNNKILNNSSAIKKLLKQLSKIGLMQYVGGKIIQPSTSIFKLIHGKDDPQRTFHTDTFYPIMKSWLFLEDVLSADGPFYYIPQSHKLTLKRLKLEYLVSIGKSPSGFPKTIGGGSLRYTKEMINFLGLPPPIPLTVEANTLVIANTFGIHRRGDANPGVERLSIYSSIRPFFPFSPFPGLNSAFSAKIKATVYNRIFNSAKNKPKSRVDKFFYGLLKSYKGDNQLKPNK